MAWSQVPTFLKDKDTGQIYMNPAKDWVQPFERVKPPRWKLWSNS